jgi:hypothetical protein
MGPILLRNQNEWINLMHASGDLLRIRVIEIDPGGEPGTVKVEIDGRDFEVIKRGGLRHQPLVGRKRWGK